MKLKKSIQKLLGNYFYNKITMNDNDCWNISSTGRDGYGRVDLKEAGFAGVYDYITSKVGTTRFIQAHKFSFLISGGTLTKERPLVLHKCFNKRCVNPLHLKAGNDLENMNDKDALKNRRNRKYATRRSPEEKETIRNMIIQGHSFYSIAKKFNIHITAVSFAYANTLEREGWVLPQRKK